MSLGIKFSAIHTTRLTISRYQTRLLLNVVMVKGINMCIIYILHTKHYVLARLKAKQKLLEFGAHHFVVTFLCQRMKPDLRVMLILGSKFANILTLNRKTWKLSCQLVIEVIAF